MNNFLISKRSRFQSPRPRSATLPLSGAAATFFACALVALGGCTTTPRKSTVDVPEAYEAAGANSQATFDAAWWQGYGDPVLTELIERAARENRDIRIAAERVRAARAGERASRSWLLPSVGLGAGAARNDNGYDAPARLAAPEVENRIAGVDISWEIDLSGRLRAGASAAAADAAATESQARGIRLLVVSDVATNYFALAGALRQLVILREISATQDETLRLVVARERAGLASAFDVDRARADAARTRALIPPLETSVAVARHRLAVLTGQPPADATGFVPWDGEPTLPEVHPGQPASLLERRPDLMALEAGLEAANWRRQQARAEWFPRLFTSALFGRQDITAEGIDFGAARFGNAAGLLAMPLFNWGRTQAINEIASAAQAEAALRYEDGIVRALEDVENALVALASERQRSDYLDQAAGAADAALARATSLYARGQVDMLPLLDAQRAQLLARSGANEGHTARLIASVNLFKALGGGWQAFEPGEHAASAGASRPDSALPAISTQEETL